MSQEEEGTASTAEDVVGRYITLQCEAILAGDEVLRGGLVSVHATRVGIRRLRSTMRVFAPLFEADAAHEFDVELTWYSALLGAVRDREVLRKRFGEAVAALPPELVLGPVAAHIDDTLQAEQKFHYEELQRALRDDRYSTLLEQVGEWRERPPYATPPDDNHALVRRAKKAARKAKRRMADALTAEDAEHLHRARKAAKRARYSAELVEPLRPEKSKASVKHFTHVQDVLGAYQDSIIAAETLRNLGASAGTLRGHNGFTYGVLYAREEAARERALRDAADL